MKKDGSYIEIAGGTITEKYEQDYNMYTGGSINLEAAKSINQTGENEGVSFNPPKAAPVTNDNNTENSGTKSPQ
jgi:hypothetical protein